MLGKADSALVVSTLRTKGDLIACATLAQVGQTTYTGATESGALVMDWKAAAIEMRRKAWQELSALPAFAAFKAADKLVVELGGESLLGAGNTTPVTSPPPFANKATVARPRFGKRKNVDIAIEIIERAGAPMATVPNMQMAIESGASVGGKDPINNWRSQLSRDERLYSFRHSGGYFWWLAGKPLPEDWIEAAGGNLLGNPAASIDNNQEGGGGHGPATT